MKILNENPLALIYRSLAVLLAGSAPLSAAIVFDNSANSPASDLPITGQPTTRHFEILRDFEVGNNTNRLLVISVTGEDYDSVTQVTFGGSANNAPTMTSAGMVVLTAGWSGGVNLTQAISARTNEVATSDNSAIYYLLNPNIGTSDIYVEVNEGVRTANFQIGVASFYNVLQQAPISVNGTSDTDASTATLGINATAGGLVYDAISINGDVDNSQSLSATGGQTVIYNDSSDKVGGFTSAAGYELTTVDGLQTQGWNLGADSEHGYTAVSFDTVPEPSVAGLSGLVGTIALLRRKR